MVANAAFFDADLIPRMRARFGEDLLSKDAKLGVRTAFVKGGGITCKVNGPTTVDITAWATTDAVDSVREVVLPEGCDWTSYFMPNGGNLFVDHCYGASYRVGKARSMPSLRRTPSGGSGWLLTGVIRTDTTNPNTLAVLDGARDGSIGMSIGFEAMEWGDPTPAEKMKYPAAESIIRKARILEVSYTYMPCNVECQTQTVTYDEAKAAEVRELCTKGVLPERVRKHLRMPTEQVDTRKKVVVLRA